MIPKIFSNIKIFLTEKRCFTWEPYISITMQQSPILCIKLTDRLFLIDSREEWNWVDDVEFDLSFKYKGTTIDLTIHEDRVYQRFQPGSTNIKELTNEIFWEISKDNVSLFANQT
jgi:hypothetical protein